MNVRIVCKEGVYTSLLRKIELSLEGIHLHHLSYLGLMPPLNSLLPTLAMPETPFNISYLILKFLLREVIIAQSHFNNVLCFIFFKYPVLFLIFEQAIFWPLDTLFGPYICKKYANSAPKIQGKSGHSEAW